MNKDHLKNAAEKMSYLEKNRQLANDVLCIVEEVQVHLSNKLKLTFKDLDNSLLFATTDEEKKLENFARYKKFIVCVISETSKLATQRIIKETAKNFGVDLHKNSAIRKI